MRESTLSTIETILQADPTVTPDVVQLVREACRGPAKPKRKVTIRKAAEILGVHPRTVGRYAKEGKLTPIRFSRRRLRYDLGEVQRLAERGIDR